MIDDIVVGLQLDLKCFRFRDTHLEALCCLQI